MYKQRASTLIGFHIRMHKIVGPSISISKTKEDFNIQLQSAIGVLYYYQKIFY